MILSLAWAGPAELILRALAEGHNVSPAYAAQAMRRLVGSTAQELLRKYNVVQHYPTTRHGGDWQDGKPTGVVDHYTAGDSTRGTLLWFSSRARSSGIGNSSAHEVVSPEGEIITVVNPLTTVAWHAGRANNWAIGIEHVNCGKLTHRERINKFYYRGSIPYTIDWDRPPAKVEGDFWEPYTTPQVLANILFKRLARRVVHTLRKSDFTQHSAISPSRKIDCGPLWPIQEINDLAFSDVPLTDFDWANKPYMNLDVLNLMRCETKKALKTVYPHVEAETTSMAEPTEEERSQ